MQALGYNIWLYKYVALIIAGFFAGISGVLFVHSYGLSTPSQLGISNSALVLLMAIIGGAGTLFGPAIGAALIILFQFFVSLVSVERWPLILGLLFVAAAMYGKGGMAIHLSRWWNKIRGRYGSTENRESF